MHIQENQSDMCELIREQGEVPLRVCGEVVRVRCSSTSVMSTSGPTLSGRVTLVLSHWRRLRTTTVALGARLVPSVPSSA